MYLLYRFHDKTHIRDIRMTNRVRYNMKLHSKKIDFSACVRQKFPPVAENITEREVQEINYNIFIKTMADLVNKYTPKN